METNKKEVKYYMDKLFVGGLSFKTTDRTLEKYFSQYGKIKQANVMKHTDKQVSRGFGFVIFEDPSSAELAMKTKTHSIDGRKVDVRWALPKEMAPPPVTPGNDKVSKPAIRKVFVGGLPPQATDSDLIAYFKAYGEIENATVLFDREQHKSRGFGFVQFKQVSSVNMVLQAAPHYLLDKAVEIRKAYPKEDTESAPTEETTHEVPAISPGLVNSPFKHSTPATQKKHDQFKLEFFDEEDNTPLPSYRQKNYKDDSLIDGGLRDYSGSPNLQRRGFKNTNRFFTQNNEAEYGDEGESDAFRQPLPFSPSLQRSYTQYSSFSSDTLGAANSRGFSTHAEPYEPYDPYARSPLLSSPASNMLPAPSPLRPTYSLLSEPFSMHQEYDSTETGPAALRSEYGSLPYAAGHSMHQEFDSPLFSGRPTAFSHYRPSVRYGEMLSSDPGHMDDWLGNSSHPSSGYLFAGQEGNGFSRPPANRLLERDLNRSGTPTMQMGFGGLSNSSNQPSESWTLKDDTKAVLNDLGNNRSLGKQNTRDHGLFNSSSGGVVDRE